MNERHRLAIVQQLVDYWSGRKPDDPMLLKACSKLAYMVRSRLDSVQKRRINDSSNVHRTLIAAILEQLIQQDVTARALAQRLVSPYPDAQPQFTPPARPNFLLTLEMLPRGKTMMEVRVSKTFAHTQRSEKVKLPYSSDELYVVLKAVRAGNLHVATFSAQERRTLTKLGLLNNNDLVANTAQIVGQRLYRTLLHGKVASAFDEMLNHAQRQRAAVHLQLRFDHDAVALARYPWELLHDEHRPLVQHRAVQLTRYVTCNIAPLPLNLRPPIQLLYVAPRPNDLEPLPQNADLLRIRSALADVVSEGLITIHELPIPTVDALDNYLASHHVHILHFDGHGSEEVLMFEDATGDADPVGSNYLGSVLHRRGIEIVVLLACSTGVVRGETVYSTAAPALILAGVPGVVATQSDISSSVASKFADGMYRSLAQNNHITAAVNDGRGKLREPRDWFIPVLYLRANTPS